MNLLEEFELSENKTECKGLIFKARTSTYQTKRGFASTTRIDLMKSLSCSGCEQCDGLYEYLEEDISCGYYDLPEGDLVDGNLYKLVLVGSTDYCGEFSGTLILNKMEE